MPEPPPQIPPEAEPEPYPTSPPAAAPDRPLDKDLDSFASIPWGSDSEQTDLQRLQTLINLVPVVGIVPSLWTLIQSDPAERSGVNTASRMAVVLALGWVSATVLLGAGASLSSSHTATLRLLLANGFVGTGYFLVSFWLMWRVWRRKSVRLPIVSSASRRLP